MEEIQNNHRVRNIAIVLVVLAIIGGAAFYFFYWLKSPQYSLTIIRDAVKKHDLATFEKYVDVNNINSKGIDAMLTATISPDDAQNPILGNMILLVKNVALPHFNSQMRVYVETGSFAPLKADDQGQQIAAAAAARTGLENLTFKSITNTDRKNDTAIVTCQLRDTKLNKDFTLQLLLQRLPNQIWQLKEITNLGEFLVAHDEAVSVQLSKLNEPISKEIDSKVEVVKDGSKVYKIERVDETVSGVTVPTVQAAFSFKLLDPNVTRVRGNVEFYDKDNQVLFSRAFDSEGKDLSQQKDGIWSFADAWRLNSFDTMDKKLIAADMSTTKGGVIFTGVTLKNGKEINFLTELPE